MVSYFYKGELVSAVRFFSYGKEHRVEFMLGGERYIEQADVLTTERPPAPTRLPERKVKEAEMHNVYVNTEGSHADPIGEPGPDGSDHIYNAQKEESSVEEEVDEDEPEDEFTPVKATRVSNDKSEVLEAELSFHEFIEKHDLDEEAVRRVLDGEQKTHKGFTFENQ